MESWTEKHRPGSLDEIVGNKKAVTALREWALEWQDGSPQLKAVILAGLPGTGKTSAALALAKDMGWTVVEMNASDTRDAAHIKDIAMRGAIHGSFSDEGDYLSVKDGMHKLIILDEADNLYEAGGKMGDRGGKKAIIETIQETKQPIILIVNDLYNLTKKTGGPLKKLCLTLKFTKVPKPSLKKAVREIASQEGFTFDDEALIGFAEHANGDMRSAINDMEAICRELKPGSVITADHLSVLGDRDVKKDVFSVVGTVLKKRDAQKAMDAFRKLDESPDTFLLWIDENVPYEYTDPADLERAYEAITRADIMLNQARATQDYSLWPYAINLMTAGVSLAKEREYGGHTRWQFPSYLSKRGVASRSKKADRDLMIRIGEYTHSSINQVRMEIMPYFEEIFANDDDFAAHMVERLDLTKKEIEQIAPNSDAKTLLSEAERIRIERQRSYSSKGLFAFDNR